jgi:hypothetical protein
MRFNIDVVFLNRHMRILGLAENVPPWRIVVAPKGTARVLELAAGKIASTHLTIGTYLVVDRPSEDPSERTTVHQPRTQRMPCERLPIQFSLRLPLGRHCPGSAVRTPPPYRCVPGDRAARKPNVEN